MRIFRKKNLVLLLALLLAVTVGGGSGCSSVPRNSLSTHSSEKWESSIAAYEQADLTNPPPAGCIVFAGSSYIRLWKTLARDFPHHPVVNRGFGGCHLADVYNFSDRIIIKYRPRQVVMYAGGNDINSKKEPATVFGDFKALTKKLRTALPGVRITFISCPPSPKRWEETEEIRKVNALIAGYCRKHRMDYVDTFSLMLDSAGKPRAEIYADDQLHINDKGYALYRDAVAPFLVHP